MEEEIKFTRRFPRKILGDGIRSSVGTLAIAVILVFLFLFYNHLPGLLIVLAIIAFQTLRVQISAIGRTIAKCQEVVIENKSLSEQSDALRSNLVIDDVSVASSNERLKILYLLALVFLPLFFFFRWRYQGPLLGTLNLIIYITALITGVAVHDLNDFDKYFNAILSRNKERILSEKALDGVANSFGQYPQKTFMERWKRTTLLIVVISAVTMSVFFMGKISGLFLFVIPLTCLALIFFMLYDVKRIALLSLAVLGPYDEYIKSKFHLAPITVPEKEKAGFSERVKSQLEKNGYYGMAEKYKKDIGNLFKR